MLTTAARGQGSTGLGPRAGGFGQVREEEEDSGSIGE